MFLRGGKESLAIEEDASLSPLEYLISAEKLAAAALDGALSWLMEEKPERFRGSQSV